KYLMGLLSSNNLWLTPVNLHWRRFRHALTVLIAESASRGHGATIVLLPSRGIAIPEKLIFAKYRLEADLPLRPRFEEVLIHGDGLDLEGKVYRRLILENLQRLAQLSTVDGALILTPALELVAFGAKLQAPSWNGEPLLGIVLAPDEWGKISQISGG